MQVMLITGAILQIPNSTELPQKNTYPTHYNTLSCVIVKACLKAGQELEQNLSQVLALAEHSSWNSIA